MKCELKERWPTPRQPRRSRALAREQRSPQRMSVSITSKLQGSSDNTWLAAASSRPRPVRTGCSAHHHWLPPSPSPRRVQTSRRPRLLAERRRARWIPRTETTLADLCSRWRERKMTWKSRLGYLLAVLSSLFKARAGSIWGQLRGYFF